MVEVTEWTADGLSLTPVGRARLWECPSPSLREGGCIRRIEAYGRYVLAGEDSDGIRRIADGLGERVAAKLDEHRLLLCFGNCVGLVDLGPLRVEVCTGKLGEQEFQAMLADLVLIAAGLAFSAGTPTALPYDRSRPAEQDPDYHAFVYLRHILDSREDDALLPALEAILREPHRRFERETSLVPFGQAQRVEPAGLQRIPGGGRLVPVGADMAQGTALGPLLRRASTRQHHLPTHVEETRPMLSFDTPENRFVKAFLDEALGVIDRMDAWAREKESLFRGSVHNDCRRIRQGLEPIRRRSLWAEVGPMVHVPVTSTVLQRRRGYREVYGYYNALHLASNALPREVLKGLLESKDVAFLYEIWCFYRIAAMLRVIWGDPSHLEAPRVSRTDVTPQPSLKIEWPNGGCLLYNATFRRSHRSRRSYSLPLRPDATLICPRKAAHLFDAKLRVDSDDVRELASEAATGEDAPTLEERERRGTFKSDDLHKMHTYKDAIPSAQSVWILYPGTAFAFFDERHGARTGPDTLPPSPAGVGAIPLQPGDGDCSWELRRVLHHLTKG